MFPAANLEILKQLSQMPQVIDDGTDKQQQSSVFYLGFLLVMMALASFQPNLPLSPFKRFFAFVHQTFLYLLLKIRSQSHHLHYIPSPVQIAALIVSHHYYQYIDAVFGESV